MKATETNSNIDDVTVVETMTITVEDPTSRLNDEVKRIAQVAETAFTGRFDGVGTCTAEKTLYMDQIVTAENSEQYRWAMGLHRNSMAGLGLGVSNAAFKYMEEHPDVNVVRADIPTEGKDYYSVKVTKQRDVAGKPSFGIVQVSHEVHGTGKNDQMNIVKEIISNKARDIFANL